MKLCKGCLIYPHQSPSEWVDNEAPTFTNSGIIGIVCDDQESAFNELAPLLMDLNPNILSVDSDNSTMLYNSIHPTFSRFTDHMYDYMWAEQAEKLGGYGEAPQGVPFKYNFEYLDNQSRIHGFIAVVFIKITDKIKCLDKLASQISLDYTKLRPADINIRHVELRCQLSKYYIYNQEEGRIYDFMEFQR